MTALAPAQPAPSRFDPWMLVWMGVLGAAVGYAYCLWVFVSSGEWWLGQGGRPADLDFVCFWSAGRLAAAGQAALAFTPAELARWSEHAAHYPFFYPPAYLLLVAPLGLLPFSAAAAAWVGVTLTGCLAAVRAITPRGAAVALAAAAPAAFFNVYVGQNGLLTSALFGGALVLLDRRPIVAGLLIAALAYKPHFGPLIPLVLMATGRWRAFLAAGAGVAGFNLLAGAALGPDVFPAFLGGLGSANGALLETGALPWWKVQSLYGLARWQGLPGPAAWALHAALALPVTAAVVTLWRSRAPDALKFAALPAAALLVSPYSAVYDYALLTIPVAFLIRDAARAPLLPLEVAGLAAALLLPLFFIIGSTPTGVPAALSVLLVVGWRWGVWRTSAAAASGLPPAPWRSKTSARS